MLMRTSARIPPSSPILAIPCCPAHPAARLWTALWSSLFQLPGLGAVANPFDTSIFHFNIATSSTGTPPDADLYDLGRRASATVLASDYYGKTSAADPTGAIKLQDNILIPSRQSGLISTNATGGTALKNYLNLNTLPAPGPDNSYFCG